jgi:glyoxylase-like metal-dependent hydrolase (beta-lactamase superfamily II)
VLANGAFAGAAIHASRSTAETMRQRCSDCMERLEKKVGRAAMAGTRALIPDQIVEQETVIHPGGRALRLLPLGDAHSHGDLAVLDEATGSLISGDLGNSTTLPELFDGNTVGWINALQNLLDRTDVERVIPGFGPPAPQAALKTPLLYLQTLQQFAEEEVAAGAMLPPSSVPEALQDFGGRAETHLLNLQHAMREAEAGWWLKSPAETSADHPKHSAHGHRSGTVSAAP